MDALRTPAPDTSEGRSLAQGEEEVLGRERWVSAESARLVGSSGQLGSRLDELRRELTRAAAKDPLLASTVQELKQTLVPILDVDAYLKAGNAARLEAIQARRKAMDQAERAVSGYSSAIQLLVQQLETYQLALGASQARQKEAAEAAARQKAIAEAMRRIAVPPPAPKDEDPELQPTVIDRAPIEVAPKAEAVPKRGQRRIRMQAVVDLSSDTNFYTGFSTNLSEGGIFIATVHQPPQGSHVEVKFSLPHGGTLEVKGVVRWTREVNDRTPEIFPGVGVQFTSLPHDAMGAIKQFLAEREPMFFPD